MRETTKSGVNLSRGERAMGDRWFVVILALFIAIAILPGCSGMGSNPPLTVAEKQKVVEVPVELNVSAATSLKDALQRLARDFEEKEKAKIIFNFASSGDLQTQIEQGAPADIFVSAGKKQMDALEQKKLIDVDSRANLLGNDLVVIVPGTSKVTPSKIEDLINTKDISKVAIGVPEITPVGQYTKEALEKAKIWAEIQPRLVMAKDVHQILSYVESGNADAGFVYRSDVKMAKESKLALAVPGSYHKAIIYPIAVLKGARQPELAAKYSDFLKSKEASNIFKEYGFKPFVE